MIRMAIFGFVIIGTIVAVLIADLIQATLIFVAFVMILAIPTISTWIRPKIKESTLNISFLVRLVVLVIFMIIDFVKGDLDISFIFKGIAGSLMSLLIGTI